MKKILLILLTIVSISCQGQLVSLVLRGDTLYSKNPSTGDSVQLTKLVPSKTGQSGKMLSTNGTDYTWAIVPVTTVDNTAVVTALGFTPYNATNPNGYITSVPAQSFASLTGKPTTILGYGVTDYNSLGDARWSLLAHNHTLDGLSNITITTKATGDLLKWNGTAWINFVPTYISSYTETDPIVKAISGLVKSNGTTISAAVASTDYALPNATNTNYASDYRAANFVAGTNYLAPAGNGSALTGITESQVTNLVSDLSGKASTSHTHAESTITFTDITTNNVSTTAHGFMPKATNSTTTFYRSDGTQATPTGVNSTITFLGSDVINNNGTANTIADVTGLSFAVTSGITYRFKFFIVYSSAATTTGSRWTISGPTATFVNYNSNYTLTATTQTINSGLAAYDLPAASNATSLTTGNIAVIEGIIKPSANGTVIARFASEVLSSAITAKAGQSYIEFQAIN